MIFLHQAFVDCSKNTKNKQLQKINQKTTTILSHTTKLLQLLPGYQDDNFSFDVSSNNFVLAKATWGIGYTIEFSVFFKELPKKGDQAQNLIQFISADDRLVGEKAGVALPLIEILNLDGTPTMGIGINTGFDGQNQDVSKVFYRGLEEGVKYHVYITLTNDDDAHGDNGHINGKFTALINNEETKPDSVHVNTLIIYNNLGIFAGNGPNPAEATINGLKINNIFEPVSLQSTTKSYDAKVGKVIGTASSWTDVYRTAMDFSIDKLPDQKGNIANLFSMITSKKTSPAVADLYSTDLTDYDVESSQLPSVNVKTQQDGSNIWCVYKNSGSSNCDLTLKIPKKLSNAKVSLMQVNVQGQHRLSCKVNGESLTVPGSSQTYTVVNNPTTYDNVKFALATPYSSNKKDMAARGFFDIVGSVIHHVTTVGTIAKNVLNAVLP